MWEFEKVISVIALIVSIANVVLYVVLTVKYNRISKQQMLIAQGALETQIRAEIGEATRNVLDMALKVKKDPKNTMNQKAFAASEEILRNAYEDACAKYLAGKVDKSLFRKMYQKEIQSIVEESKEKYDSITSTYTSTIEVYQEWFK